MIIQIQNKASKYPLSTYKNGYGYFYRARSKREYGIVIHSTNGNKNSSYENEVEYLFNSPRVTAHYIISKAGIVTNLLPIEYAAWHSGYVNDKQYDNNNSIGIELHYTPGEYKNLPKMMQSCYEICKLLRSQYPVADIRAHRDIAIFEKGPLKGKLGRKIDPSNLNDEEFKIFRNRVMSNVRIVKKNTQIYTDEALTNPATHINTDSIVSGKLVADTLFDITRLNHSYWLTNGYGFIGVDAVG